MIDTYKGSNLVFICGAGHSGTTLYLAIMDTHKEISAIPVETGAFHRNKDYQIKEIVKTWPEKYNLEPSANIYVEKTPVHGIYIKRIFNLFPESKILLIVRDGRDSTISGSKRLLSYKKAVNSWAHINEKAIPFMNDPRVFTIKYEKLIKETEYTLSKVCEFLQIGLDKSMLEHQMKERKWWDSEIRPADNSAELTGKNHKINRNWQINQPIYSTSIGRWKKEMDDLQKKIFKEHGNDTLIKLGYVDKNENW